MNFRLFSVSLLVMAPIMSYAGTFFVQPNIELLAIDGKKFSGSPIRGSSVELSQGKHQFVWRFSADLRNGSARALFETTPEVLVIDLGENSNIELQAPRFSALSQGKAYFRRNEPWKALVDGKEVTLETEKLPGQGFMPYANIEKPLAAYNLGKKNQWAPEGVTKLVATQLVDQGNNGETLATFKLLYQNATDEQKAQIKQWINAQ